MANTLQRSLQRLKGIQEDLQKQFNIYEDQVRVIRDRNNEKRKSLYQERSDHIKQYPNFWQTIVSSLFI
jgi:predicted patatin/cPLA2 family phospholipase